MIIINRLIIIFFIPLLILGALEMVNADEEKRLKAEDVKISANAIGMPPGRILLIRKDNEYCAVKFLRNLTGKTDYEQHAEYESYYQGDKTGNLNSKKVNYRKEEVYYKKSIFSIFGHPVSIGEKLDIRCGPIELWWSAGLQFIFVYFNRHDEKQGDYYGIELAPTPWTDISQVNVFDKRIKWYRYDDNRKDEYIPIDKLWEDTRQREE